jgi:hypothetical protein
MTLQELQEDPRERGLKADSRSAKIHRNLRLCTLMILHPHLKDIYHKRMIE